MLVKKVSAVASPLLLWQYLMHAFQGLFSAVCVIAQSYRNTLAAKFQKKKLDDLYKEYARAQNYWFHRTFSGIFVLPQI